MHVARVIGHNRFYPFAISWLRHTGTAAISGNENEQPRISWGNEDLRNERLQFP
jgi:hypothetical protein